MELRFFASAVVVLLTVTACSDDEPPPPVFEYPCNEGTPTSVEVGDDSNGTFQAFSVDNQSFSLREGASGSQGDSGLPWIGLIVRAVGVPETPNELNVTVTDTTVMSTLASEQRRDVSMACDEAVGWVYTSSIELPGDYVTLLGSSIKLELSGAFAENSFDEVFSGTLQ